MQTTIIIAVCTLLLISYVFDITSAKTRIPSVVLLLALGWTVRQATDYFSFTIPNLFPILPVVGTIGLILIVLEGALELELNPSKYKLIINSFLVAFIPLVVFSIAIGYAFHYFTGASFKDGLANAIPLAVISSSIAIPSARNFAPAEREFITYESSLSDIIGVIFFNFITLNDNIGTHSVTMFLLETGTILFVSFVATIGLAVLLKNIRYHVKFAPIILLVVLIYAMAKLYHLPSLVFILIFGLVLGNLDELKQFRLIQNLRPSILQREVNRFKEIVIEMTFLIRALFFLLFGFLIETAELLNGKTFVWALGITGLIFLLRAIVLLLFKQKLKPLLFVAPRGLITILLFLSIPTAQTIEIANNSLLIQVVVLSSLVMMTGSFLIKKKKEALPLGDALENE